eukprot:Gb_34031 [translate_table: standard]
MVMATVWLNARRRDVFCYRRKTGVDNRLEALTVDSCSGIGKCPTTAWYLVAELFGSAVRRLVCRGGSYWSTFEGSEVASSFDSFRVWLVFPSLPVCGSNSPVLWWLVNASFSIAGFLRCGYG